MATILGITNGSSIPAGMIGEYIENARTSSLSMTSGVWGDADSGCSSWSDANSAGVTLTPGVWDLALQVQYFPASNTTISYVEYGIGTAKQTVTTGRNLPRSYGAWDFTGSGTAHNDWFIFTIPRYRVTISATTTYYAKALASFTVNTMVIQGVLSAVRVG